MDIFAMAQVISTTEATGGVCLPDAEVDRQDQPEMHPVDAQLVGQRQEDRHQHQDRGRAVDDGARQQEEDVDGGQNDPVILRDAEDRLRDVLWNALVGEIPAQQCRGRDD